jgi:pimeloyl-ACP methyl ester carboxylesterase
VSGTPRFVATNGIRVHYSDSEADGPPLVLVPGLTANRHSFDGLLAAGLGERLRVLAFDARGRGLSDKPDAGYTMADHSADLLGALDALGLERVAIGGHSFGGLLTYYLAAHHRERVEQIVVLDAPTELDPAILDQIAPSLARLERSFASWREYDELVRSFPYWDGFEWSAEVQAYYRGDAEEFRDGSVRSRAHPEHIHAVIAGELEVDWQATLARVACPVLLVRATAPFGPPGSGPILSADVARRAIALLPEGRLLEMPGNHITFLFGEHAPAVVDAIVEFVLERRKDDRPRARRHARLS